MAILMPHQDCQIDITAQGVQLTRTMEVTRSYPDNHCLSFFLASKCGGATFTIGVSALSLVQKAQNLTLDVPGGPLSEVRDWFCAKKVIRVPNSGGGPLRVNP